MNKKIIVPLILSQFFGVLAMVALLAMSCTPSPAPAPVASATPSAAPAAERTGVVAEVAGDPSLSRAKVSNGTSSLVMVYLAFGADSVVLPSSPGWSFCQASARLNCTFPLAAGATQDLPLAGNYLNVTVSFNQPVTCNTTKAELNLNNPNWHDIMDVSLVDGFSVPVEILTKDSDGDHVFAASAATGNEKATGVFPLGCDICVQRQKPPCGFQPGPVNGDGCKAGTQYAPNPICQYQAPAKKGGSHVIVRVVSGTPGAPSAAPPIPSGPPAPSGKPAPSGHPVSK